ncbi:unnamed protein product [Adineta ricciae]|uniref:Uncharacterized protein n=1 Tax=Adineta ricciae TaxID=249248 RepID=A0A814ZYY5_ADIRI|nr:unnamed protein product [Adineta ricciae]
MVRAGVTNIETEMHTNEPISNELKDESSLARQLTEQHTISTVYRPVSRRKRCRRQSKRSKKSKLRKKMQHKRMMPSTPKPSQDPSLVHIGSTTNDSLDDIRGEEYKFSSKEIYEQEKIDVMDREHQWTQQSLDDFENFNELEEIVRLHEETERVDETEAVRVFAALLEQEARDQHFMLMENKENFVFLYNNQGTK